MLKIIIAMNFTYLRKTIQIIKSIFRAASLNNEYLRLCSMGLILQRWIVACVDCGCIFSLSSKRSEAAGECPVCKSRSNQNIEGFKYN